METPEYQQEVERYHRESIRDPHILWSSSWVDDDPDNSEKEVDCGDGTVFRCSPHIADYVVECVNRSKEESHPAMQFLISAAILFKDKIRDEATESAVRLTQMLGRFCEKTGDDAGYKVCRKMVARLHQLHRRNAGSILRDEHGNPE